MLECIKGSRGRMIYYINGNRVNPKIAELYAQTNNLKIPKCSRKTKKTHNGITTVRFDHPEENFNAMNISPIVNSDLEEPEIRLASNEGSESLKESEEVGVDLVSDVKEKITIIISNFKNKIETLINSQKDDVLKNIEFFNEKINEISNTVNDLKIQNRILDKEIDKVEEPVNIEKLLEERTNNLQLIKELEAYMTDLKYDIEKIKNEKNTTSSDIGHNNYNCNEVEQLKTEILEKLVDLEEIVEQDKEKIIELQRNENNIEKYIEEINNIMNDKNEEKEKYELKLEQLRQEHEENIKKIKEIYEKEKIVSLSEKKSIPNSTIEAPLAKKFPNRKIYEMDTPLDPSDLGASKMRLAPRIFDSSTGNVPDIADIEKNMIKYMNEKKKAKYKKVDEVNEKMKEKVLTLKETKKYEDIINDYNIDIKKCEKIINLINELK